jgi:hypothetical protein
MQIQKCRFKHLFSKKYRGSVMSYGKYSGNPYEVWKKEDKKTKKLFVFPQKKNLPSNHYVVQSVRENLCSRKNDPQNFDQKTTRNTRLEQKIF